jgi:O-antigen ligase
LWSVDPRTAITQGTLYFYFFTVLGFKALVELWDVDALIALIAKLIAVCAVLSLIFPTQHEFGDFTGIFSQKNVLGQVMAAGVFTALHGWRTQRSLIHLLTGTLCGTVAQLSQSTTSLLVIAIFVGMDILGRLYLRGGAHRALGILGAVLGAAVVIFFLINEATFFEMLGKDPTLTGRTEIWPYAIANIYERPLFGWGYFGFWTPANPAAISIAQATALANNIANAHNTLLEALLEMGIVGTTLFLIVVMRYVIVAIRCFNGPANRLGLSALMLMCGLLILGFSEVVLLPPQAAFTVLFFMIGMACEKALWQYPRARYGRPGLQLHPRHIRPNRLVRPTRLKFGRKLPCERLKRLHNLRDIGTDVANWGK